MIILILLSVVFAGILAIAQELSSERKETLLNDRIGDLSSANSSLQGKVDKLSGQNDTLRQQNNELSQQIAGMALNVLREAKAIKFPIDRMAVELNVTFSTQKEPEVAAVIDKLNRSYEKVYQGGNRPDRSQQRSFSGLDDAGWQLVFDEAPECRTYAATFFGNVNFHQHGRNNDIGYVMQALNQGLSETLEAIVWEKDAITIFLRFQCDRLALPNLQVYSLGVSDLSHSRMTLSFPNLIRGEVNGKPEMIHLKCSFLGSTASLFRLRDDFVWTYDGGYWSGTIEDIGKL